MIDDINKKWLSNEFIYAGLCALFFLLGGGIGYYVSADIGWTLAEEQCFNFINDNACDIGWELCYNITENNPDDIEWSSKDVWKLKTVGYINEHKVS